MASWFLYALLAAVTAALVGVLSKIGIAQIDATLATTLRGLSIAVFMGLAALFLGRWPGIASVPPKTLAFILLTGVMGGLSWFFGFMALKAGGDATVVNAVDRLSIVFLLVLAVAFLGEELTMLKVAGALLIALGAFLMSVKPEALAAWFR
jgi:transporter family protein